MQNNFEFPFTEAEPIAELSPEITGIALLTVPLLPPEIGD